MPIGRYFRDLLDHARLSRDASRPSVSTSTSRRSTVAPAPSADRLGELDGRLRHRIGVHRSRARVHGTSNDTGFCDPAIDQRMEEATRLRATDPAGASDLWSKIEHDLVDQAPWVPLGTRYWVQLVSQRLGNYQSNPQWGPLVDQMWVG